MICPLGKTRLRKALRKLAVPQRELDPNSTLLVHRGEVKSAQPDGERSPFIDFATDSALRDGGPFRCANRPIDGIPPLSLPVGGR
jgi:hypothetical protein